jgi:hypothetical protein
MLWRQTMQRIHLRLSASAAFHSAAQQTRLRRRRASILATLHSAAYRSQLAVIPEDQCQVSDDKITPAMDRWYRAISLVIVQSWAVKRFKLGLKRGAVHQSTTDDERRGIPTISVSSAESLSLNSKRVRIGLVKPCELFLCF